MRTFSMPLSGIIEGLAERGAALAPDDNIAPRPMATDITTFFMT